MSLEQHDSSRRNAMNVPPYRPFYTPSSSSSAMPDGRSSTSTGLSPLLRFTPPPVVTPSSFGGFGMYHPHSPHPPLPVVSNERTVFPSFEQQPATVPYSLIPSWGTRSPFLDNPSYSFSPPPLLDRGSDESKGSKESRRVGDARDFSSSLSDFSKQMASVAPNREDDDMSVDMKPVIDLYSKLLSEDDDEPDLADENNFQIQDRLVMPPSGTIVPEGINELESEQPKQEQKKKRKKKKKKRNDKQDPQQSNWVEEAEPFVPTFMKGREDVSCQRQQQSSAPRTRMRRTVSNFTVISAGSENRWSERDEDTISVSSDTKFTFNRYVACKPFFFGVCGLGYRCKLLHIYEDPKCADSGRLRCRSRYVDALCRVKTIVLPTIEEMKDSLPELASNVNGCLLLRIWLRNASKEEYNTMYSKLLHRIPVMMRTTSAHQVVSMLLPQLSQAQLAEVVSVLCPSFGITCCNEFGSKSVEKLFDSLKDPETISFFMVTVSAQAQMLASSPFGCALFIHFFSHCKQSLLSPLYDTFATDGVITALLAQELCPCVISSALEKASKVQRTSIVIGLARNAKEIMDSPRKRDIIRFVTDNIRDPGVGSTIAKSLEPMIPSLLLDETTVFVAEKIVMSYDREAQRIFVHSLMKEKDLVPAMLESIPASRVLQAALVNVTARQYIHLVTLLVMFKPLLETTEGGRLVSSKMTRAVTDGNEVFEPERAAAEKALGKTRSSPDKSSTSLPSSSVDQTARRPHHHHKQHSPEADPSSTQSSAPAPVAQYPSSSSPRKHKPRSKPMTITSALAPPPSPPKPYKQHQRSQRSQHQQQEGSSSSSFGPSVLSFS